MSDPMLVDQAYRLAASHHFIEYLRARRDAATGSERAMYELALEIRERDGVGPAPRTEPFHIISTPAHGKCGKRGRVTRWVENADCADCLLIHAGEATDEPPTLEEIEEAYHRREQARGDLAYAPDELDCYACCEFTGVAIKQTVVKKNPVNRRDPDPTQTYTLECGHVAS